MRFKAMGWGRLLQFMLNNQTIKGQIELMNPELTISEVMISSREEPLNAQLTVTGKVKTAIPFNKRNPCSWII
jgi:hypothetical protein